MRASSLPDHDEAASAAAAGARATPLRRLAWVVGALLVVVGAATTTLNLSRHDHGIGPYLLAGGFLVLFLASYDAWRDERTRGRKGRRLIRKLAARVDRKEECTRHLEHDRDGWRRMQAEEAAANRQLLEEIGQLQQRLQPRVSGGTVVVATTIAAQPPIFQPPEPPPTPRRPPRHSRRRPAENQPGLFDQDEH
jgi:hypothetical protein